MGLCPAAEGLRVRTADRSGGVGSSRTLGWPVLWVTGADNCHASSLTRGEGSNFPTLIWIGAPEVRNVTTFPFVVIRYERRMPLRPH